MKISPQGSIDQLGHSFMRMIHAFVHADEDINIFIARWEIKDGFWRLNCVLGEELNLKYVLPQEMGEKVRLVVPTSLWMRWIESPSYFFAVSENEKYVTQKYVETPVGPLPIHKFVKKIRPGGEI